MEEFQEKLESIYQSNCSRIKELDEKIKIVEENINKLDLVNAMGRSAQISFSGIIAWIIMLCSIEGVIFPTIILNCMPCAVYAIGIVLSKEEEKLKTIFNLKNQKEQIETQVNYEIQREKLNNYNQIIEQTLETINNEKELIDDLSSNYIIMKKKQETTIKQVIENVKKQQESLNKLYMELDNIVIEKAALKVFDKSIQKVSVKQFLIEILTYLIYMVPCTILGGSSAIAFISYFIPNLISTSIKIRFLWTKEKNTKGVYKKIVGKSLLSSMDSDTARDYKLGKIDDEIALIIQKISNSLMMLQENDELLDEMLTKIGKEVQRNNVSQYYINNDQAFYQNDAIMMETQYSNDLKGDKQKTYHI